jgi:serine/threonine-protein kinase
VVPARAAWIGKYEIVGALGAGGTSEVFLARAHGPRGFARTVVLKRLLSQRAADETFVSDFAREARAYARLDHPTIVVMYEFFEHEGRPVLALEHVDGLSLQALLATLRAGAKTLGDTAAIYVMAQVFAALAAAHEVYVASTGEPAYVVHRDVAPGNVLLGWDGRVKLTDFGIAKLAGVHADTLSQGLIKGTFGYMAPEQVLTMEATPRTDIYSACLLLRELLIGRETFVRGRESQADFLHRLAHPAHAPIETLRSGVPAVVCRALEVGLRSDPARREITAAEIRDVLLATVDAAQGREELVATLASVRAAHPPLAPWTPAVRVGSRALDRWFSPDAAWAQEETVNAPYESFLPPAREPSRSQRSSISALARETAAPAGPAAAPWRSLLSAVACAVLLVATVARSTRHPTEASVRAAAGQAHRPPRPGAETEAPPRGERVRASDADESRFDGAADVPDAAGEIVTERGSWSERIFVDGRGVGETGVPLHVLCGRHEVRIGSQGQAQDVDVPCGGSVAVEPRW